MIKVIDNFFSEQHYNEVVSHCKISPFYYGEKDNTNTPPTGMVSNIDPNSQISFLFNKKLKECNKILKSLNLYRIYINCFAPSENPYFHKDGKTGITCLYYPTENWSYDDGGETQFIINEELKGILPIANRMVLFDANLLHRATSFRDKHRFTIAIKYK
jgi:hypothetical protein